MSASPIPGGSRPTAPDVEPNADPNPRAASGPGIGQVLDAAFDAEQRQAAADDAVEQAACDAYAALPPARELEYPCSLCGALIYGIAADRELCRRCENFGHVA